MPATSRNTPQRHARANQDQLKLSGIGYTAVTLEDAKKLPIFPSTSRANVAEFLLHSAVQDTFIRQTVIVTDTK